MKTFVLIALGCSLLFGDGGAYTKKSGTRERLGPCDASACYVVQEAAGASRDAIALAAATVGPHPAAGGVPGYTFGYCFVIARDSSSVSVGCSLQGQTTFDKWLKDYGYTEIR